MIHLMISPVPSPIFKLLKRLGNSDAYITMEFPGTVIGAIDLNNFLLNYPDVMVQMSSDFNHPDEFPMFEKHSIDIAAGYLDGAISDGVIEV